MNNALMPLPKCTTHNIQMDYVIPRTPEQRFVGTMYKCPYCGNSVLLPSPELRAQLERQKASRK